VTSNDTEVVWNYQIVFLRAISVAEHPGVVDEWSPSSVALCVHAFPCDRWINSSCETEFRSTAPQKSLMMRFKSLLLWRGCCWMNDWLAGYFCRCSYAWSCSKRTMPGSVGTWRGGKLRRWPLLVSEHGASAWRNRR